ncbi:MAG: ATP-binding protein, partial [Bacteroidota bacterium]
ELRFTQDIIDDYNKELEKLSIIASQTDNAVLVLEINGDLVWANSAYEKIFGYRLGEYISKGLKNYISISSYPNIENTLINCVDKKETQIFESDEIRSDNTRVWVQNTLSPIINSESIVYQLVCISSDITKIKEAELEIIKQKEEIGIQRDAMEKKAIELAETLDNLKKTQRKLIDSEKMAALGQLISGVAHEINTPLGATRSSIENIENTLKTVLTELPEFFFSLSPEIRPVFMDLIKTSFKNDMVITSKEERKIKREVAQNLDEMGIPDSYKIADILTEMGIYDNFENYKLLLEHSDKTRLLTMAYKLSGLLRSSNIIASATERASKVVFALKSYAHFNSTEKPVFANVQDGLETVLTLYYNKIKYGVELTRKYIDTPQIECYPDDLNQVWTNMIHNALQAMEYKGKLSIQTKLEGGYLVISIKDSGKGIPEEIKSKIFDPFFTTKPMGEGSGLGLEIVQKIIKKHNGKINFESEPGKTVFNIYLPTKNNQSEL